MTKYQKLLQEVGIIPEDIFNDIIASFPEYTIDFSKFDIDNLISCNDICYKIINIIISENYYCIYLKSVDWESKTFELECSCSVDFLEEELEEIKNKFPKWTISNYEEILEDIKSLSEDTENIKKKNLFDQYVNDIPYRDLKEFLAQYDKK